MKIQKVSLSLFILALSACTTAPTETSTVANNAAIESEGFTYTTPTGKAIDLNALPFKTNGMVRTQVPDVLGVGGTTYKYTRFGGWNSTSGQADIFVIAHHPTKKLNLTGDQIYYGRALRSIQQSVYDNRLTYSLNFDSKSFTGFSVSLPDSRTFGDKVLMKGQISGETIEGTVESGKAIGKFTGRFYGDDGIEMAGIARFSDPRLDFAFGGDRQ